MVKITGSITSTHIWSMTVVSRSAQKEAGCHSYGSLSHSSDCESHTTASYLVSKLGKLWCCGTGGDCGERRRWEKSMTAEEMFVFVCRNWNAKPRQENTGSCLTPGRWPRRPPHYWGGQESLALCRAKRPSTLFTFFFKLRKTTFPNPRS